MEKRIAGWSLLVIAAVLVVAWKTSAAGQSSTSNPDVLNALLIEVRGLRAAIEQLGSAGPRVQLALGRLQMQEQRIAPLLQRLNELRERIGGLERETSQQQRELAKLQEMETRGNQEEREAAMQGIRGLKNEFASATAELQRLRIEESELAANVASEQARWVDINQRLDELERALGKK